MGLIVEILVESFLQVLAEVLFTKIYDNSLNTSIPKWKQTAYIALLLLFTLLITLALSLFGIHMFRSRDIAFSIIILPFVLVAAAATLHYIKKLFVVYLSDDNLAERSVKTTAALRNKKITKS